MVVGESGLSTSSPAGAGTRGNGRLGGGWERGGKVEKEADDGYLASLMSAVDPFSLSSLQVKIKPFILLLTADYDLDGVLFLPIFILKFASKTYPMHRKADRRQ